ncbi:hypothetical protein Pmani_002749 [Petrolisthes manimaculis]|uniref:Uncharacterized protein n=1 Tax=Petrolisthes manimaculis TaxID=1843537 RepID=A0AAE1QH95_9EUCA|nr:hypothetical protein Pmani_002749 [Petrolisthes manimaculis]
MVQRLLRNVMSGLMVNTGQARTIRLRTVVDRFNYFADRNFHKLKNTQVYAHEDLYEASVQLQKTQREQRGKSLTSAIPS